MSLKPALVKQRNFYWDTLHIRILIILFILGNTTFLTTFVPENHQQIPFLEPNLLSQSSMTEAVFVPSNLEHGFKPINSFSNKDVTNSRYDRGPAFFTDNQRYHDKHFEDKRFPIIPIPLRKPEYFDRSRGTLR